MTMIIEGAPHCVYMAYSESGEVIYIGSTSNPRLRVGQHKAVKPWWPEVVRVAVDTYPSKAEALAEEKKRICAQQPKYNITHHDTNRPMPRPSGRTVPDGALPVTAVATRSGDWWAVEVPEIPGLLTQARRLEQVPEMVADAAKPFTGQEVDVRVEPVLPDRIREMLSQAKAAALWAEEAQRKAAAEAREVAAVLRSDGLSVRDVGEVMGVSPQRVSQLCA